MKKKKPKFDIEISSSPFPFVTIIRYMSGGVACLLFFTWFRLDL